MRARKHRLAGYATVDYQEPVYTREQRRKEASRDTDLGFWLLLHLARKGHGRAA